MKILITQNGRLEMHRGVEWKQAWCPFGKLKQCTDECPHFGEPRRDIVSKYTEIHLSCGNGADFLLSPDDFADERPK